MIQKKILYHSRKCKDNAVTQSICGNSPEDDVTSCSSLIVFENMISHLRNILDSVENPSIGV